MTETASDATRARPPRERMTGALLFAWCTSLATSGAVASVDTSPELFVCFVGGREDGLMPGCHVKLQRPWYESEHVRPGPEGGPHFG